jgi:two-component system nitrate/nitrite response regulator NarL
MHASLYGGLSPIAKISFFRETLAEAKREIHLRVLIADDHPVVRKGLSSMLESRSDLQLCGEAANGEEAFLKSLEMFPDLIILDVTMPVLDGFHAAKKIREKLPEVPILMLSMHDGPEIIRMSQSVGAQGFINKSQISEVLLKAIDVLLAGGNFFANGDHASLLSVNAFQAK